MARKPMPDEWIFERFCDERFLRIFDEVMAEVLAPDSVGLPSREAMLTMVDDRFRAQHMQLVHDQVLQWFRRYKIDPKSPNCWKTLVIHQAHEAVEERARKPVTKPIGATRWTYAGSLKLCAAVEAARTAKGNSGGAYKAVRNLPEYKSVTNIKVRYHEAKRRIKACAKFAKIMGMDPDDYLKFDARLKAARRRMGGGTKISA